MKRALRGCANPRTGDIDTDAAARAIMTHRNTPHQHIGMSPSEMLFGYKLRDHLPNKFRSIRQEWKDVQKASEIGRQQRKIEKKERSLEELSIGDSVSIQNQVGNNPTKWSNTGVVVEVLPNRQYNVMLDGSRRVSLRNRRFLRRIPATCRSTPPITIDTFTSNQRRPTNPPQVRSPAPSIHQLVVTPKLPSSKQLSLGIQTIQGAESPLPSYPKSPAPVIENMSSIELPSIPPSPVIIDIRTTAESPLAQIIDQTNPRDPIVVEPPRKSTRVRKKRHRLIEE